MTGSGLASLIDGLGRNPADASACRHVLWQAMSNPARLYSFPMTLTLTAPRGLMRGATIVLLIMADDQTPVWLAPECDTIEARAYLHFHTGCPVVEKPEHAAIAVMSVERDLSITEEIGVGLAEYPDRSATAILESEGLIEGVGPQFSGPGITEPRRLSVAEQPEMLWQYIAANQAVYPRGVNWIFASPAEVLALPKATRIEF